ncbi:MAG: cobalamin B12-binding domain-containing protein [bacterium]
MTERILVGKVGLDGHDRGAKVVARGLRDAGYEVIYSGIRKTPEEIARAAVEEDVDVVGLSSLSGGHMTNFPDVLEELERLGRPDIPVFAGGVIPEEDAETLKDQGILEVFGPGTDISTIIEYLETNLFSNGGG